MIAAGVKPTKEYVAGFLDLGESDFELDLDTVIVSPTGENFPNKSSFETQRAQRSHREHRERVAEEKPVSEGEEFDSKKKDEKAKKKIKAFKYQLSPDSKLKEGSEHYPFCEAHDDEIIAADDPWLKFITPPNHYNCKSKLVPVMVYEKDLTWGKGTYSDVEKYPMAGFGREGLIGLEGKQKIAKEKVEQDKKQDDFFKKINSVKRLSIKQIEKYIADGVLDESLLKRLTSGKVNEIVDWMFWEKYNQLPFKEKNSKLVANNIYRACWKTIKKAFLSLSIQDIDKEVENIGNMQKIYTATYATVNKIARAFLLFATENHNSRFINMSDSDVKRELSKIQTTLAEGQNIYSTKYKIYDKIVKELEKSKCDEIKLKEWKKQLIDMDEDFRKLKVDFDDIKTVEDEMENKETARDHARKTINRLNKKDKDIIGSKSVLRTDTDVKLTGQKIADVIKKSIAFKRFKRKVAKENNTKLKFYELGIRFEWRQGLDLFGAIKNTSVLYRFVVENGQKYIEVFLVDFYDFSSKSTRFPVKQAYKLQKSGILNNYDLVIYVKDKI